MESRRYRKPGTLHGRFPHVTQDSGLVLYVAEFSNGVIKLGMTESARCRLSSSLTEARRLFGPIEVLQFYVSPRFESRCAARHAEVLALGEVRRVAMQVSETKHNSEYFTHIEYDVAVGIVGTAAGAGRGHTQHRVPEATTAYQSVG